MRSKLLTSTFLGIALFAFQSCRENNMTAEDSVSPQAKASGAVAGSTFSVPVAGNSFLTVKPSGANEVITSTKLGNWTNANSVISTYFRVSNAGTLNIGLKASVPSGTSVVKVTVGNVSKNVTLTGSANTSYTAGDFNISTPGYVKVDLQGVSKTGGYFADVTDITFSGTAASGTNIFSNDTSYYYWARRGPSCHLGYTVPTSSNVSYYYNEVTAPVGEDKIGSYFMANGFGEGYFGIQVNSATERRVLFSVWSPFPTDDPNNIPPDHKIVLNRAGSGVTIGEFGNEGSGGQSYYKYNWTAGQTYKFLLKGEPDGTGKTDYTAWFLSPDTTTWKLIASWKRPQTSTYLKGFYSFVENFNPENGYMGRKAEFKNQWVRTSAGNWQAVSAAKFTVDATYNAQQRIDAMGGTNGNSFFLQNGGFFSTIVAPGTQFSVTAPTQAPDIDFSTLP
ncbi:nematoblast specific protein [Elizabethkingia anophelis]|nr:nematoblast specific protein [Elizabethkingia anophelis]MDV3962686.1 nematoblast specific protein [Elizabethkingia anophelis]